MAAKLVLFDCDGVLINTEEVGYEIISGLLNDAGLPYSREEYVELLSGVTYKQFFEILQKDFKVKTGYDLAPDFKEEIARRMKEADATRIKPIDGVVDLLVSLRCNGIPFAVASNSKRVNLIEKLEASGLYNHFESNIYSSDDVCHPKPAPDIYLLAASRMGGRPPHECVVIEDSVTGAMSGVLAGMHVLGFAGGQHRVGREAELLRAAGVQEVVWSMAEAKSRILALFSPQIRPPAFLLP